MSAVRMDGKALSAKVRGSILAETEELKKKGVTPGLAVIIVGNDPASEIYVRNKERACEQCGFYSEKYALPEETSQEELLGLIAQLNESPQISGILCQMSLFPFSFLHSFSLANTGRLHSLRSGNRMILSFSSSPPVTIVCLHPAN